MENSLSSFFETLLALVLTTLGITFIGYAVSKYGKYDKFLVDRNDHKSTVNYTTAYMDYKAEYTDSMVLNDILSSDIAYVVINGTELDELMLKSAREGNESSINAIRSYLSGTYKKSYAFMSDSTLTGILFESY